MSGYEIPEPLTQSLQAAEERLEDRSGKGSGDSESEPRDVVADGEEVQEALERRSNASNGSSIKLSNGSSSNSGEGTLNSLRVRGRAGHSAPLRLIPMDQDTPASSSSQISNKRMAPHERAVSSTREADCSSPGSGVQCARGDRTRSAGSGSRGSGTPNDSRSGGHSDRSGHGHEQVQTVNIYHTMSAAQQDHLEDKIKELDTLHQGMMHTLQDKMRSEDAKKTVELHELMLDKDKLQELLDASLCAKSEVEHSQGNLEDEIAGLLARLKKKEDLGQQAAAATQLAVDQALDQANQAHREGENQLEIALAETKAQHEVEEVRALVQAEELHEKAQAKEHQDIAMARIQELLDIARREISRRSSNDVAGNDFREAQQIEGQLCEARDAQRLMKQELAASRLELLQTGKEREEIRQLIQKGKGSQHASGKGGYGSGGRGHPGGPGPSILSCIEEEFDDDEVESQATSQFSGQVSEEDEPGDRVSDNADSGNDDGYDPANHSESEDPVLPTARGESKIIILQKLLQQARLANEDLQGDKVSNDAVHLSKVSRLSKELLDLQLEVTKSQDAVTHLREEQASARAGELEALAAKKDEVYTMEMIMKRERSDQDKNLELMTQKLFFAEEAKRFETARLADTKRELEAVRARHTDELTELRAQLQALRMSNADGGQCEHNEALMASSQQELLDRLRAVEEERNSLRNEVDTVRSELSGSLEVEQLQHAVTRNMLQRVKEDLAQQGDHVQELREKLQVTEQELEAARRTCEDSMDTIRAQGKKAPSPVQSQAESPPKRGWSLCPSRHPLASLQSDAVSLEVSLQTCLWQVLQSLKGTVALLCSADSLVIHEATKKAFEVWGCSHLSGDTPVGLSSLLVSQRSGTWLQNELLSAMQTSRRFWVRELGCLAFRSRSGRAMDCIVIAAHLPKDMAHPQEAAAVMVVVDSLQEVTNPPPSSQTRINGGRRHDHTGRLSQSSSSASDRVRGALGQYGDLRHDSVSAASSDIGPNDSISNVL